MTHYCRLEGLSVKTYHYKMIRILILIMNLFALPVFAQDNQLAVIRKIQGVENLPSSLSRQLEKSTLQIIARQPGLELLLSGADIPSQSPVDAIAIESEIGKNSKGYRLETRLLDLKSKKLINKASLNNIREEDLLRMYESALQNLFLPYEKARQEKLKEEKPVQLNPPVVAPKSVPSTTQLNLPDAHSLDFKKRVRELKFGVDDQIVKTVEQKELEEAKRRELKKLQETQSQFVKSSGGYLQKDLVPEQNKAKLTYPSRHRFGIGYDMRSVQSISDLIDTSINASLMTLSGTGHFPFLWEGKLAGTYELSLSRAASAPAEVPMLYGGGAYLSYLRPLWEVSAGLFQDNTFFINLENQGQGLTPFTVTTIWMRVKSEFTLDIYGEWLIGTSYGIPVQSASNYSPVSQSNSWSGSHIQVSVSPPIRYGKFDMNVAFEQINLNSQGERPLTLNDSRIAFSVRRSL